MTAAVLERPAAVRPRRARSVAESASIEQLYVREWATHLKGVPYQVLVELAEAVHVCGRGSCPRVHCENEGLAWLTIETIAFRAHRSERAVRYALRALEAAGEIVAESGGTCRSWGYRLLMPAMPRRANPQETPAGAEVASLSAGGPVDNSPTESSGGGQPVPPRGATSAPGGGKECPQSLDLSQRYGVASDPEPDQRRPGEEEPDGPPAADSQPGCPTHPDGDLRCRSCKIVRRTRAAQARTRARAEIKSAAREARAEVERAAYGPRGTKDGPQRLAGSLDHAVDRIPNPQPGEAK